MGALGTGKDRRRHVWEGLAGQVHLHPLLTEQLHAGSAMLSATPILPEQRSSSHLEWMQQDTDPTRFCGLSAMPLALLSQRTPSTLTDASGIDETQAPIAFSALFGRREHLRSLGNAVCYRGEAQSRVQRSGLV
jgi:hypothetical protein